MALQSPTDFPGNLPGHGKGMPVVSRRMGTVVTAAAVAIGGGSDSGSEPAISLVLKTTAAWCWIVWASPRRITGGSSQPF